MLLTGMAILSAVPWWTNHTPPIFVRAFGWYVLWGYLALITANRCLRVVYDPSATRVQAAVRHCVHSIIVLDAAVCLGYAGPVWGFAVFALLAPTLLLTAWLEAT
jgi:hypothetical protein